VTLDDLAFLEQAGFVSGTGVAPFPIQSDFNNASSVMKDRRVRQAFMYGCDRQGFVDSFLQGKGVKVDSYFFTPWVPKDGIKEYAFDLDQAKALLDEAAADGAFDYAQPVRWLSWNRDARDRQSFIEDCASKMSQIGVTIEIVNGLEVTNEMGKAGEWELQLYGGYPVQDPNALVQPLACSNIGEEIQENGYAWGGSNYTNYCNEDLDAIMEQAKQISDQDERAALYAQAQEIFLEDVPIMISFIGANAYAWKPDLQGVQIYGDPSQWAFGIMDWSRAAS
jgi:ABC-type transport system substrate-binding protein